MNPSRHPRVLITMMLMGLSVTGCLTEERHKSPAPILPLAVGNTWNYIDSIYEGDAMLRLDSLRVSITGTRTVTASSGLQTVYLWNVHNAQSMPSALQLWLQNRADGNHTVGAEQESASFVDESMHVKYPATASERYPIHFLSFTSEGTGDGARLVPVIDTLEGEVVSVSQTCVTPAGVFACVHYRGWRPGNVLHADSWYAPGVGWLGSETTRLRIDGVDTTTVRVRRLLKSFALY
jgi:hypothetical protein